MPVTVAAQRVQRSAFPSRYADDEALARAILRDSTGDIERSGIDVARCRPSHAQTTHRQPERWSSRCRATRTTSTCTTGVATARHWARMHTGTDLSAPCGTPVLAATGGQWSWSAPTSRGPAAGWSRSRPDRTTSPPGTPTCAPCPCAAARASRPVSRSVRSATSATRPAVTCTSRCTSRNGSIYPDNVNPSSWLTQHVGRPTESDAVPVSQLERLRVHHRHLQRPGREPHRAGGKEPWMASGPSTGGGRDPPPRRLRRRRRRPPGVPAPAVRDRSARTPGGRTTSGRPGTTRRTRSPGDGVAGPSSRVEPCTSRTSTARRVACPWCDSWTE